MESAEEMFTGMFETDTQLPVENNVDYDADAGTDEKKEAFGYGYQDEKPVLSADELLLQYPEDATVDAGFDKSFRELCCKIKITPKQAQALVDWEMNKLRQYGGL